MATRVKIRGIYSTALAKMALDSGFSVVQPSIAMRERFGLELNDIPHQVLIQDREDLQGIEIIGETEQVCHFLSFLQEKLLDVILVKCSPIEARDGTMSVKAEFPGESKRVLDVIRDSVTPTVSRHHRLRTIDAKALEKAEIALMKHPEKKADVEGELFSRCIVLPLEKEGVVRLEHVRPSGKAMRPREGVLISAENDRIVFKRSFSKGRYDGLDIPIQPGDYCLTEIREGDWFIKHAYFTRQGEPIGEYYNINTPVELYPYGARYLDLEVDLVRRTGEPLRLLDREKLSLLSRNGSIAAALEEKAMAVAEELKGVLE
ncbi:MAG: DUF402 domain-containing protein [Acidobacteriota bacterium]